MIRLATWMSPEGPMPCLAMPDRVWPLSGVSNAPTSTIEAITRWDEIIDELRSIDDGTPGWLSVASSELLAPVPRPGKIMAIGLNYADHVAETGQEMPPHQIWFSKQSTSANGPFAEVQLPRVSQAVDYEVELVVVIGRRCRHVTREDAPDAVFGYCVGNDVSARDWQLRTAQWDLGKSFDTHAPFGPWITPASELKDPHNLAIRCFVNDEMRQQSNTEHLCFNVWDQVSYLSQVMTLEPGDVIFTGTPGGVGMGMKPPRFLTTGDIVRCEIDQVGTIENRFAAEA